MPSIFQLCNYVNNLMRHEMIQSWIVDNQPVFHEWEGITAPCHDIIWNAFDLVNAMLKHFLSKTHAQHVLFTKIIQIDFFFCRNLFRNELEPISAKFRFVSVMTRSYHLQVDTLTGMDNLIVITKHHSVHLLICSLFAVDSVATCHLNYHEWNIDSLSVF